MLVGVSNQWVINGMLVALLGSGAVAQRTAPSQAVRLDEIIQSVQKAQAAVQPQSSYQIIREYRLFGGKDSKAESEVVAEINFTPPASKGYAIQRSSGISQGPQLVRRILDHEIAATSQNHKASSAINNENYSFNYVGEATLDGHACYVLGLKPKRTASDLIVGQAWVDKQSFLIRQVQGEVEKTPSWWLRTVQIKLVFADLDGIWVQKSMEAIADVRVVGSHTLTSRILDYRRQAEVAETPYASGPVLRKNRR